MVHAVPGILARIVDHKRTELAETRSRRAQLERMAANRTDVRDFRKALLTHQPSIISEIKKASPSKGILSADFDPAAIAGIYARGGAAALSVLTDQKFFRGSLRDLEIARASVQIPVLRKDFTIDPLQVIEAVAHGADAILLIAAVLSELEMRDLRELAASYKLAALVEVHDWDELQSAIASGADIIGVNSRNLNTFEVNLETALLLAEKIPADAVKVAESGIHSREDVRLLQAAGFHAFLVGEHLMKSGDPAAALEALRT